MDATMFPDAAIPLGAQIAEVERELDLRRRLYPQWLVTRKLTQVRADNQMAALEAVLATLKAAAELADACLAYNAAIAACANSPDKMASFCSAEGDDLDSLYARWLAAANQVKSAAFGRQT